MAKVIILGGAGFIGSNLSNWLIQYTQHRVVAIDNLSIFQDIKNIQHMMESKRFRLYVADALQEDIIGKIVKIENPDFIINATSDSSMKGSIEIIERLNKNNLFKIFNIYSLYNPAVEELIRNSQCSISILLCNLYGSRQHCNSLIPKLMNNLSISNLEYNSLSIQKSDWMYITDALAAICLLLKDEYSGTWTITSGYQSSEIEIFHKIVKISGISFNAPLSCAFEEQKVIKTTSTDITSLGWRPTLGLDESLEHTVCWYASNPWALINGKINE